MRRMGLQDAPHLRGIHGLERMEFGDAVMGRAAGGEPVEIGPAVRRLPVQAHPQADAGPRRMQRVLDRELVGIPAGIGERDDLVGIARHVGKAGLLHDSVEVAQVVHDLAGAECMP